MAALTIKRISTSAPASGLSWGAVIGIAAAGGAAILGLAVFTIVLFIRSRHRRKLRSSSGTMLCDTSRRSSTGLQADTNDFPQPSDIHMRPNRYPCFPSPGHTTVNSSESLPAQLSMASINGKGHMQSSHDHTQAFTGGPYLLLSKKKPRGRANALTKSKSNAHLSAIIESPKSQSTTKSPTNRMKTMPQTARNSGDARNLAEYPLLAPVTYSRVPDSLSSNKTGSQANKSERHSQRDKPASKARQLSGRSRSTPSLMPTNPTTVSLDNFDFVQCPQRISSRSQTFSHFRDGSGPSGPLPALPGLHVEKARSGHKTSISRNSAYSSISSLDSTSSSILRFALSPNMMAAADFSQRHPEMELGGQIRERETDLKSALIESSPKRRNESPSQYRFKSLSRAASPRSSRPIEANRGLDEYEAPKYAPTESASASMTASSIHFTSSQESGSGTWENFKFPRREEITSSRLSADEGIGPKEVNESDKSNLPTFVNPKKRSALKGSSIASTGKPKSKHSVTISLETTILGPPEVNGHRDVSNEPDSRLSSYLADLQPNGNDDNYAAVSPNASSRPTSSIAGFACNERPASTYSLTASSPTLSIPNSAPDYNDFAEASIDDIDDQARFHPESKTRPTERTSSLESVNTSILNGSRPSSRGLEQGIDPGSISYTLNPSRYELSEDIPRSKKFLPCTPTPPGSRASVLEWSEVIDVPTPEHPAPLSIKHSTESSELLQPTNSISSLFVEYYSTHLPTQGDSLSPKASGEFEPIGLATVSAKYTEAEGVYSGEDRQDLQTSPRRTELYALQPSQTTSPRGPRDPPGRPLKSTVKALRQMGSILVDEDMLTNSRGLRRYLSIGREASPNLTGTSPDLRGSRFIQHATRVWDQDPNRNENGLQDAGGVHDDDLQTLETNRQEHAKRREVSNLSDKFTGADATEASKSVHANSILTMAMDAAETKPAALVRAARSRTEYEGSFRGGREQLLTRMYDDE